MNRTYTPTRKDRAMLKISDWFLRRTNPYVQALVDETMERGQHEMAKVEVRKQRAVQKIGPEPIRDGQARYLGYLMSVDAKPYVIEMFRRYISNGRTTPVTREDWFGSGLTREQASVVIEMALVAQKEEGN